MAIDGVRGERVVYSADGQCPCKCERSARRPQRTVSAERLVILRIYEHSLL